MSEKLEQVTEAIRLRALERGYPIHPRLARHLAAAAIETMREPTADMIDAGRDVGPDAPYGVDETLKRWQAMIDEALK